MAIDDPVNSPKHYTQGDMEVITAIEGMGLDYHQGNVVKYVSRYRYKGGIQDLKKAKWYIDRLIFIEEERAKNHYRRCTATAPRVWGLEW
jgi:hypothetical protein